MANRILADSFIVTFPCAVPVQAAGDVTVRTRHRIKLLCKLVIFLNAANILGVLGTYIGLAFSAKTKSGIMRSGTLKEKSSAQYNGGCLERLDGTHGT